MPLIIPSKTINDSFNLSDFQNDFNYLNNNKSNNDGSSIYYLAGAGSTGNNYWAKVCSVTLTYQYANSEVRFELFGGASGSGGIFPRATVECRVKQQNPLGQNPSVDLNISNATIIGNANVKAVTTVSATNCITDIYVQYTNYYENYCICPIFNAGGFIFYNNLSIISVLPTGTFQTVSSLKYATNFNGNGYKVLDSGIILQWGGLSVSTGITVTFPIAFPNICLKVYSQVASTDGRYGCVAPGTVTSSGFTAYVNGVTSGDFRWYDYWAIGY
ncbi:hypothetical protein CSC2_12480 [Clostridium zeae]|uniref:Putative tail fiber protein gp53-like C-terminal domain-containing protein n=1 Tax=Clostridium zeae TaxID=2759022 RepID=A0ABQ1E7F5_9CLOT|nr:hypothetical protein [Clostridium zeae]GFZ30722.1 hypothetical protein CSC2_12480 [Clostridium zeae]